ncbi:MAG: FUN14 domain-containing protein [Planctomycetota bacterium]
MNTQHESDESPAPKGKGLSWWQILLASAAVLAMAAGIALPMVLGGETVPEATATATGDVDASAFASGFAPSESGDTAAVEPEEQADRISPVAFRMGFSFFVGFAIGFALRAFVRLSLIGIGLFALLLFGMQYAGFVDINWGAIGDRYESGSEWFSAQFKSFSTFASGELPSAALAMGGLAVGLKRK